MLSSNSCVDCVEHRVPQNAVRGVSATVLITSKGALPQSPPKPRPRAFAAATCERAPLAPGAARGGRPMRGPMPAPQAAARAPTPGPRRGRRRGRRRRPRGAQVGRFPDSPDSPRSHRAVGPADSPSVPRQPRPRSPGGSAGLTDLASLANLGPSPGRARAIGGFPGFQVSALVGSLNTPAVVAESRPQGNHRAAFELTPPTRSTAYRHRGRTLSELGVGRGPAHGDSPTSCATATASARIEPSARTCRCPRPWPSPTSIPQCGRAIAAGPTSYLRRPD